MRLTADHWAHSQLVHWFPKAAWEPKSQTDESHLLKAIVTERQWKAVWIPPKGDRYLITFLPTYSEDFLLKAEPECANFTAMSSSAVCKGLMENTITFCWAENVLFMKKTSSLKINILKALTQCLKDQAHSEHLKTKVTTTFQKEVFIQSGV